MSDCEHCGGNLSFQIDIGGLVCDACGVVAEDSVIRSEIGFSKELGTREGTEISLDNAYAAQYYASTDDSETAAQRKRLLQSKKKLQDHVDHMCQTLRIPNRFKIPINVLINKAGEQKYTREKWMQFVAACSLYIVARQNNLPITLLDVAEVMNTSIYRLGKIYKTIAQQEGIQVKTVDPVELLERNSQLFNDFMPEDERKEVVMVSARLVRVAHLEWLNTGRKPASIVGAALKLSSDARSINLKYEDLAQRLGIGVLSLRERVKEMKFMLMNLSSSLPWASEITEKTFSQYLPFILNYVDKLRILKKAAQAAMAKPEASKLENPNEKVLITIDDEGEDHVVEIIKPESAEIITQTPVAAASSSTDHEVITEEIHELPITPSVIVASPAPPSIENTSPVVPISPAPSNPALPNPQPTAADSSGHDLVNISDDEEDKDLKLLDVKQKMISRRLTEKELYLQAAQNAKTDKLFSKDGLRKYHQYNIMKQMTESVPPAFIKSRITRERRKQKIEKAKTRIQLSLKHQSNGEAPSRPRSPLDEEDLEIEKLLMANVDEQTIETGTSKFLEYLSNRPLTSTDADEHTEEITEAETNRDEDIEQYIKSAQEVEVLEKLRETFDESKSLDLEIRTKPAKRRRIR